MTLHGPAGGSVSSCCSASPRLGPIPERYDLTVFENAAYEFAAFTIWRDSSCYRSLPFQLPKGPKPDRLELSFRPVPMVTGPFGQPGCP